MKENEYKCVVGTIATGDIFCTSKKMKKKLDQNLMLIV